MSFRACLLGMVIVMGCASSRRAAAPTCEETGNCEVDAGIDAPPDARRKGFAEPCTDNKQCESELCILVGTSGQCTKLCGECPTGYSCLGVNGLPVEGQVSFVCVPTSSQLCTPCTVDSECTLIGQDKCVTYPDGDKTCSQDCTSVSCPVGYECEDVPIGGINYRQCLPTSGACDCTAANPGQMQPCNIPTPWNVCIGSQTCAGATGWGTCTPPSMTDDPDGSYVDSNCDGIDGDRARAIFVSPAGGNTVMCGLTYDDPCATLPFAITRAQATGRPHVYAQSGMYSTGMLDMRSGISVFGGYNATWRRRSYTQAGHMTEIAGGVIGVRFNGLAAATRLDNVVIQSAQASGGLSSVGVLVASSASVTLSSVRITPGNGGPGSAGTDGGVGTGGNDGGIGTRGCENSSGTCSSCSIPDSGVFGDSPCGMVGGNGGWPGINHDGGFGGEGGAGGTPGGAGAPCGDSRSCDGSPGGDGMNGPAGGNGLGGGGFGAFSGTTYVVANGTTASVGNPGHGGGGGGGGGGGDDFCDSYGSSGGGGGGGGCGGGPGTGGTGAGGSFGVVARDSLVVIDNSLVQSATGGTGGRGGAGGGGGLGGAGGPGGPYGTSSGQDDAGDGAPGGGGGQGGRGGDGGGGGGGPSIAVVCLGSSASTLSVPGSTLANGSGGTGGSSAAPGATGTSAMSLNCSF